MSAPANKLYLKLSRKRQAWLDQFLSSRGPLTPPLELTYRRIFILPTAFGWAFGALLGVMVIGGLNFNNNLGLLLTFILAASAHATLHMAYSNLRGIHLLSIESKPVFVGEEASLHLILRDEDQRVRPGIQAQLKKTITSGHIPAEGLLQLSLNLPAKRRGWLKPGRIKLMTSYPLGLFVAWSWCESAHDILVYPKPAENPPPLPRGLEDQGQILRLSEGEDLVGVRDYQRGDPLPSIAWKASARHQQLQTKLLAHPSGEKLSLDWQFLGGMNVEQRLSVLCAWVLSAHQNGHEYRLSIPGIVIGPARGSAHRDNCLRALALFGEGR